MWSVYAGPKLAGQIHAKLVGVWLAIETGVAFTGVALYAAYPTRRAVHAAEDPGAVAFAPSAGVEPV